MLDYSCDVCGVELWYVCVSWGSAWWGSVWWCGVVLWCNGACVLGSLNRMCPSGVCAYGGVACDSVVLVCWELWWILCMFCECRCSKPVRKYNITTIHKSLNTTPKTLYNIH